MFHIKMMKRIHILAQAVTLQTLQSFVHLLKFLTVMTSLIFHLNYFIHLAINVTISKSEFPSFLKLADVVTFLKKAQKIQNIVTDQ